MIIFSETASHISEESEGNSSKSEVELSLKEPSKEHEPKGIKILWVKINSQKIY